MTLEQAIVVLQQLKVQHGGEVEVLFDCPHCGKANRPDKVVATAMITAEGGR